MSEPNTTRRYKRALIAVMVIITVETGLSLVAPRALPRLAFLPEPAGQENQMVHDPEAPWCDTAEQSGYHFVRSGLFWSYRPNLNYLGCSIPAAE